MRRLAALAVIPLLAACAGAIPRGAPSANPPAPRPAPPQGGTVTAPGPAATAFRPPQVMNLPGLEHIIGRNETALANLYGAPRLQVREGDVVKLQFADRNCVLDIYLYPLKPGAQPTATHVEARRPSDGQDVDRAACARALRR